jgi:hypothetical protein
MSDAERILLYGLVVYVFIAAMRDTVDLLARFL